MKSINIAIFASGSGSNAEEIIKYFQDKKEVDIKLILSNNPSAFVLERSRKYGIESYLFDKKTFRESDKVLDELKKRQINFIVLAGFLWLVPENLIEAYPGRIINIHPALLPKFGGKGMYGSKVHEAVKNAGERETGITIHQVNENYDEGDILFQASCPVYDDDQPDDIQQRIHRLEHKYYPRIIEETIQKAFKK